MSNNNDNDIDDLKKQGTRVFKKSSPNGKITAYLGKRDFIDYLDYVDPVDGVVLVDPEYIKDRKVFVNVLGAFHYGRSDLDSFGLSFRKDLYLATQQVYPPLPLSEQPSGNSQNTSNNSTTTTNVNANPKSQQNTSNTTSDNDPKKVSDNCTTGNSQNHSNGPSTAPIWSSVTSNSTGSLSNNQQPRKLTRLQERLIKKLGYNAYPFYFELPHASPASVMLQPPSHETGKPCGIGYELKAYVADKPDDKTHKRNCVKLVIRKLSYAPEKQSAQPSAEIVKDFIMSPGSLRLEASLDKEKYCHGESICVNVLVDNNSNKTIKKIKIAVNQYTDIVVHQKHSLRDSVAELESEDGFPIHPSQTGWCKVYKLCPLWSNNRNREALALDGKLKHEDTNLASSTILCNETDPDKLGIVVNYKVRVRLVLGFGTSDVNLELPFTLSHPKPEEEELSMSNFTFDELHVSHNSSNKGGQQSSAASTNKTSENANNQPDNNAAQISRNNNAVVDEDILSPDLIQLDTNWEKPTANNKTEANQPSQQNILSTDDDLIFEDFARLRLTGGDKS